MEKNTKYHNHQIRERRILMRTIRTFRKFLEKGAPEVLCKSRIYIEDISGSQKRTKMKELERQLKSHDWWYSMSDDGRAWDRGRKQADDIHKLIKDIGDDGKKLYKKYGKKAGVFESKDTGNLYSGYSFFPPTPQPLSTEEKHLKRTMIYGKVYNGG